ncbi:polysaccharide deacetylase family protein, partial [Streptomyces sp. P01-F02]|nr:polysaccharide deacetylase family protein [Streptomyces poriferorum]
MNAPDRPVHRRSALRAGACAALAAALATGCADQDSAGSPAASPTRPEPERRAVTSGAHAPAPTPHRIPGQPVQI